jgi:hypothetical protein
VACASQPTNIELLAATEAAASQYGGYASRIPEDSAECGRRLALEQIYDHYVRGVKGWTNWRTGKAYLNDPKAVYPDAVVTTKAGDKAVQIAAHWGMEELKAFHAWCAHRQLRYELWGAC